MEEDSDLSEGILGQRESVENNKYKNLNFWPHGAKEERTFVYEGL